MLEQVRAAGETGFHGFSMGKHDNIPGLQRSNVPRESAMVGSSGRIPRSKSSKDRLGSPEECVEQMNEHEARLGITYILVRFEWTPGLPPQEEIPATMRLFGEKVIQKLQVTSRQ